MAFLNENYLKLNKNYLFAEIAKRVNTFKTNNPGCDIISLGIGDVTRPLVPEVIKSLHKAVDDMANPDTFKGYSPDAGYPFLIDAIVYNDYKKRGVDISIDFYEGEIIGITLPEKIEYKIIETSEAVKGNTATNAQKDATIETGKVIKVPLFIGEGETVLVTTRDGKYAGRA